MMSPKSKYAFIALVAASFLYSGCQKAAHHPIKGTLGAAAANKTGAATLDQKADALVQAGATKNICDPNLISKNTALKTELDATNQQINANKTVSPLSDQTQKDLTQHSVQIQKLEQDLMSQFIQLNIASCGSTDRIVLSDARTNSNAAILAIAGLLGKDTPESTSLKQAQQQKMDSLRNQSFKISADLAGVLTDADQQNSMFVANGKIGSTKENYDKAMQTSDLTVCLLTKAPAEKLEANAAVSVLGTEVTTSDTVKDSGDSADSAIAHVVTMQVSMSSGSQVMNFSCRLGSDLKRTNAPTQFLNAFGSLLIK